MPDNWRAMRLAVVSDIHGNLAAFEAVIPHVLAQGADEILLAGDLAQGGRQPAEVLDRIGELGWPAVLGNADQALLDTAASRPLEEDESDEQLMRGLRWSVARLSERHLTCLRGLPRALRRSVSGLGDFVVVHSTPWSINGLILPESPEAEARRALTDAGAAVVAYGHIHHAHRRRLPEGLLVSVGSVSTSNDSEPRPTYTVFDLGSSVEVSVHRVPYDAPAEVAALHASGFPVRPLRAQQMVHGNPERPANR